MQHKTRPYLFYSTTSALCGQCTQRVEAKIIIKDQRVYMDKWCPQHGFERVLISTDADYYRRCREVFIKPPQMPLQFNTPMRYGCPWDCGLCPDHMQHSCLSIVEITDLCNLQCPVCYSGSSPHQGAHKPLPEIIAMLDAVVANEGEADVVQLSGGEPTLHPDFWTIIDAVRARPIKHLMINSNGIRFAEDINFAERFAALGTGLEVYLQFDSFRPQVLKQLRGADLSRIRAQALDNLNRLNISTTLVMTIKKGLNDDEIGAVVEFASRQNCVRGVTLQPIQDAGRVEDYNQQQHRITLSEVRSKLADQSDLFTLADVVPVPCNPDNLAMAYALKMPSGLTPLTGLIPPQILIDGSANTIVFEQDAQFKQQLFSAFSTNHSPQEQANCLSQLLCCLPNIQAPQLNYANVFRVLIVQFMDIHSMDIRALKKSCIHFATPEGQLIPFETYNLFYRPGRQDILNALRSGICAPEAIKWQD